MKRTAPGLALCTALLLFGTACAGSSQSVEDPPVAEIPIDASPEDAKEQKGSSGKESKDPKGKPQANDTPGGGEKSEGSSTEKGDGDAGPQESASASSEEAGDADSPSVGPAPGGTPASGSYVYAQQGYEEFCSGASCDRSNLPRRQAIGLRLIGRSAAGDEVLSEIKGPGDRLVQTTTVYDDKKASVTRVYIRMAYEGFVFENEYQPSPPVEILRFPLRTGASWSGSWKAETSGSYRAKVVGSETITVSGRSIEAFKVSTATTFRGEFEGTSDAQVWVDPKTRAVLRTSGLLRLKTNLGGYNTAFQTDLVSGPGY